MGLLDKLDKPFDVGRIRCENNGRISVIDIGKIFF